MEQNLSILYTPYHIGLLPITENSTYEFQGCSTHSDSILFTIMTLEHVYLTKVSAHSWAVWVVTCAKLCLCRFSLSSEDIFNAWPIELATSVMFHGFTRIAPAPND
jgi:hypothetical protein